MRTPKPEFLVSILAVALSATSTFASANEHGLFDGLRFREIGPATPSGRIDDFAVLESNPSVFYVATATGGLWKTVNNGTTFETVFDDESTSSIGDVAIAPADPNLVWVGTGENNNRQSSSWGDGVYKSTDGGKTWKNMGLRASRHIARILVDPTDVDVVYVAALGSLWGPGGERGVYKTTDGGESFERVLHVDDDTGATELVMDPRNPKVLYAATYQRRRKTWGFNGGGPGTAIYKTMDGGRNWTKLTGGIPEGDKGRIGLDLYRKNPDVVYARIEHEEESGVYRSDDGGASFEKLSSVNPRPMYFSQIRVDPNDDSRIYVLGVRLHVSDDGGRTFHDEGAELIHVDFHAMWINPGNSDHLILGGDGGVGISYDRSETYVWLNNMPLAQFYHVSFDMSTPYFVCGGLQDNNTWCGPSQVRSRSGIGNDEWFIIGGGDGFVGIVDPSNPRIMYAESQNGRMNRVDRVTNERQSIRPEPEEGEDEHRWNWDTPMMLSPHDPTTLFVAANKVFRSGNRGNQWSVVSPDLTSNVDRDELEIMGVYGKDITIAKHDGISHFPTIVTFAESEITTGLYWAGTDDGRVQVSSDAGVSWSNVTGNVPGLPEGTNVSKLAPSRFEANRVYATFDGHRVDEFGTYVYTSDDRGKSWRDISSNLPEGEVARTLTEDLKNPDVLYLGTERGLFVTTDRGGSWQRVKANLPTVPVYEIALHPRENDLILGTHGRGIWILDDLAGFQEHAQAAAAEAFVFTPPTGVQRTPAGDRMREFGGDRQFLGANPAPAALTYRLGADGAEKVALEIRSAGGETVRTLDGKPEAGVHTVEWDLRWPSLPEVKGQSRGGGFGARYDSPFVSPGTYRVALMVDGEESASTSMEITQDPDVLLSAADRSVYDQAAKRAYELNKRVNEIANAVVDLNDQFSKVKEAVEEHELEEIKEMSETIDGIRERFGLSGGSPFSDSLRSDISRLRGSILGATALPTEVQSRMLTKLERDLDGAASELNETITRVSELYRDLAARGLYPVTPKPVTNESPSER